MLNAWFCLHGLYLQSGAKGYADSAWNLITVVANAGSDRPAS